MSFDFLGFLNCDFSEQSRYVFMLIGNCVSSSHIEERHYLIDAASA